MRKTISPELLGKEISSMLKTYSNDIRNEVNAAGKRAMKKMVRITKKTAPKDTGDYAKHITSSEETNVLGDKKYIWGVRSPFHRLTHLLANGHATVNGGRTQGDPFIENALDAVLPEYEREVEEAIKNA